MNVFNYIDDILVKKTGTLTLDNYVPFIVTRWLSMASDVTCNVVNETVNTFNINDKDIHYKTLISVFPQLTKTPRINYIKKIKKEKTEKDTNIQRLAQCAELSQKEITQMLELKQHLF